MTSYQKEQFENIRRAAQRGKALAEDTEMVWYGKDFVNVYIHILDLCETIKNDQPFTNS